MNKLAAGALALALGLGAVAPAVAAESYTGAQLFLEKYDKDLVQVNKLRKKAMVAQEKIDAAVAKRIEAVAKYKEARKLFDKEFPGAHANEDFAELIMRPTKEALAALNGETGLTLDLTNDVVNQWKKDTTDPKNVKSEEEVLRTYLTGKVAASESIIKDQLIDRLVKAYKASKEDVKPGSEKQIAYFNLRAATEAKQAAELNEKLVKDENQPIVDEYERKLKDITAAAAAYRYVVQIGNNGIQLVKPEDAKVKAPGKKASIAELKRAKADAETAIKAVNLLKELSPEKIKNVEAKLNAKVAKAEELIKKADAKIAAAEKVAFIATAYADDDDTDALIKELDSTTGEIKDLIKDTPEDKKANEEKPAEKPAEDKKEEKTPSKKAGNNAKTGIAGVAGVAGILAAASVAYAASKRD